MLRFQSLVGHDFRLRRRRLGRFVVRRRRKKVEAEISQPRSFTETGASAGFDRNFFESSGESVENDEGTFRNRIK